MERLVDVLKEMLDGNSLPIKTTATELGMHIDAKTAMVLDDDPTGREDEALVFKDVEGIVHRISCVKIEGLDEQTRNTILEGLMAGEQSVQQEYDSLMKELEPVRESGLAR